MNWQQQIHTEPGVLQGKPVFKGTRLSVEFIAKLMSEGWSDEKLLAEFPTLKREHILALHAFTYEGLKDGLLLFNFRKAS